MTTAVEAKNKFHHSWEEVAMYIDKMEKGGVTPPVPYTSVSKEPVEPVVNKEPGTPEKEMANGAIEGKDHEQGTV